MRVLTLLSFLALIVNAGLIGTAQAQTSTPAPAAEPAAAENADSAIPPMPLNEALNLFAERTGLQLVYVSEVVAGLETQGAPADLSPDATLRSLLQDTGLDYRFLNARTVTIASPEDLRDQGAVAGENTIGQRQPGIEEIIVTGQKREERIQDVPIAISAFSPEDLEAQKIEGGFDLLKGVPNVTFSKTNFSGYNFQIRGIGTQAVSATTDPAVAVSFNNTTLIVNRLFEQEYLDVERVEVLRGPQGTLFGRNATAGVINVISNKPEMGVWDGMLDVEVGNYNTRRLRGFFNAPIGDEFAIRGAYASTVRDGYGINKAADDPNVLTNVSRDVDDRDLWTARLTLGWQPNDRLRVNLLWERFEEDDNRVRTSKQLCHRDESLGEPGFESLGGETPDFSAAPLHALFGAQYSQGCKGGSLYDDGAFGTVNGASLPYINGIVWAQFFGSSATLVDGGTDSEILANVRELIPKAVGPNPFAFGAEPIDEAPCPGFEISEETYSIDICNIDPYRGRTQSRDLRTISSEIEPAYRTSADIFELSFDYEVTDNLLLSSQSVYVQDKYFATQDYNRFSTFPIWNGDGAANACGTHKSALTGKNEVDCTEPGEEFLDLGFLPTGSLYSGRGTFLPLTDADGDGNIDQGRFGSWAQHGFTVDDEGFIRNPEDRDNRVGYYNLLLNEGGPNTVCDPQLGCSRKLVVQDLSRATSTQYNQEFRLASSFPGDWNFSLGANFTRFRTVNDYFVFSNAFTHVLHFWPFNPPLESGIQNCPVGSGEPEPDQFGCRYIDPSPIDDLEGDGHNYFRSSNPYKLTSSALFGELYWNATDTVKLTLGLRMTWDRKVFTPVPSQLLLMDYRDSRTHLPGNPPPEPDDCQLALPECPLSGTGVDGRGSPPLPDIVQEWNEPTGRLVVDWSPVLDFTDETMVYASFARGYKGGGANPPGVAPPSGLILEKASQAAVSPTFEPEFVNAYELGTKNTLFGGALTLNGTAFYYDYTDYQVSKIVDRRASNENFDAEVWGLEFESIFAPSLAWQFNAAIGYLQTEIADGERSIDLMDRAQGGNQSFTGESGITYDDWTVVKPWVAAASNCIIPTDILAAGLREFEEGLGFTPPFQRCPSGGILGGGGTGPVNYIDENDNLVRFGDPEHDGRTYGPFTDAPNFGAGFFDDLSGNELPNAPRFTVALGGQYNFDLTRDWQATARVDYYWQDQSFARVYNTEIDRLKSWSNTNLSFWINNPVNGITVEAYVKNVFDETPITGTFLNSDDSGLTTNVFTLDPRLIGVSIRKEF